MRALTLTYFICGIVAIILDFFIAALSEWPRKKQKSLAEHLSGMVLRLAFVLWAGIVLFNK